VPGSAAIGKQVATLEGDDGVIISVDLDDVRRPVGMTALRLVDPSAADAEFELRPDWVCEVLSPSTEKQDRTAKLSIYARAGVPNAWLINPVQRTLEALRLTSQGWLTLAVHHDEQRVRAEPFDAIELGVLWADLEPQAR
jgi:Uma2 family endonuclease